MRKIALPMGSGEGKNSIKDIPHMERDTGKLERAAVRFLSLESVSNAKRLHIDVNTDMVA